jgi:hypothetical protein
MAELPTSIIERLRGTEKPTEHLDPDLISAFLENSLNRADRKRVFQHLGYCSQCREISALCLPEHPVVAPRSAASTWLGWPVLRWGVVAACLVVVASLSLSLRHRSSRPLQLPRSETAAVPQASSRVAQAGKAQSGNEGEAVAAVANMPTPSSGLDEVVPGQAKKVGQEPLHSQLPQAGGEAAFARAKMSPAAAAFEKAATVQTRVPRWTLTSDRDLERSFDAGTSWETVPLPSQARFHVLSAYGMDIWLGGSSGALYHSVDAGAHWVHVEPVANGQALSEDVIGMEFTDDDHGVLTTSTNQKWATEDCGQSWQKK